MGQGNYPMDLEAGWGDYNQGTGLKFLASKVKRDEPCAWVCGAVTDESSAQKLGSLATRGNTGRKTTKNSH